MEAGIPFFIWLLSFCNWVAIALSDITSLIQKIEQELPDALGGLSAIFAHPHQGRPVPRPQDAKNDEPAQLKLPIRQDKAIEIGQLVPIAIANAFDAMKRDATHLGHAGNRNCLHIDESGLVGGGKTLFLGRIGDALAGY
jgi:hypothetical protein